MILTQEFEVFIAIELKMRCTETFDVRWMDLSVFDQMGTLLFDLSTPIIGVPTDPVVFIVTIGQRTSDERIQGMNLSMRRDAVDVTCCST